jgi:putative transcriptional regulator
MKRQGRLYRNWRRCCTVVHGFGTKARLRDQVENMSYRYIYVFLQAFTLLLWALPALGDTAEEKAGIFLVAKKEILDPNFRETVVLVRPISEGAIGVIINRQTDIPLSKLFPDDPVLKGSDNNVYFGGPVYPRSLVFMFRSNEQPRWSLHIMDDIYLGLSLDLLQELLSNPEPTRQLKVYAGHSGWGQGQLQNEIERGDWYVVPADAGVIFEMEPEKIWPELIKRATTRKVNAEQPELRNEEMDLWYQQGVVASPAGEWLAGMHSGASVLRPDLVTARRIR